MPPGLPVVYVLPMTESGGDRREARRVGARHEELRDAGVREAGHADLVVEHPGLRRDGLDDVVAVEELKLLEVVVRAAGAARAAHVHAHGRVAHDGGDLRARVVGRVADRGDARAEEGVSLDGPAGLRGVVARVVDDGGVGALVGRAGHRDVGGELRPVAGRDVVVALHDLLPAVEALRREAVRDAHHAHGPLGATGGEAGRGHLVAFAGGQLAEDEAPERIGLARLHERAARVPHLDGHAGRRLPDVNLLDAPAHLEARRQGRCAARAVVGDRAGVLVPAADGEEGQGKGANCGSKHGHEGAQAGVRPQRGCRVELAAPRQTRVQRGSAPRVRRPDFAVRRPDLAVRRPDLAVRHPDLAVRRADPAVRRPHFAVRCADPAVRRPHFAVRRADPAVRRPHFAVRCADPAVRRPHFAVRHPDLAVRCADPAVRRPHFAVRRPDLAVRCAVTSEGCPSTTQRVTKSHGNQGRTARKKWSARW